jgi:hypothetical protein
MPSVVCNNCSKKYRVDDSAAGRKFVCKQCGNIIRVPATTDAPPVVKKAVAPPPIPTPVSNDMDFDALASLESTGEIDNSVPFIPSPSRGATVVAAGQPKAAKKFSAPRIGFRINRIILIVIGLGIGALVWGGRELLLASSASDTAQDITCEQLSKNGPGGNLHVRVTNFMSMSNYVWHAPGQGQEWDTVWLPIVPPNVVKLPPFKRLKAGARIVPADAGYVNPGDIHVLVKTHVVKREGDVNSAMSRQSVEGMVINKIESLSEKDREFLHQGYPTMSVDSCYIVEDGRKPLGGLASLLIFGGLAILGFGIFLVFKPE